MKRIIAIPVLQRECICHIRKRIRIKKAITINSIAVRRKIAVIVLCVLHVLAGELIAKKIEDTVDKPLYDQMHARLQTPYASE